MPVPASPAAPVWVGSVIVVLLQDRPQRRPAAVAVLDATFDPDGAVRVTCGPTAGVGTGVADLRRAAAVMAAAIGERDAAGELVS